MVVQRVQRRLKLMGQEMIPEIELEIPLSCRALAVEVMNTPNLQSLLLKTNAMTFTAGTGAWTGVSTFDLSTLTDLLRESVAMGRVTITGYSYPASYYPTRMDLERGTPLATVPRFTVEGDLLLAKASSAITTSTAGVLIAHFVPTVHATTGSSSTLPDPLLPHLIEVIAGRIMPQGGAAQ